MARRAQPLTLRIAATAAALAVALLLFATLAAVALRADAGARLSAADWAAVRFTLGQAALSAVLSVGLAVPVARALARRRFAGRGVLLSLLGAPFLLPTIVAVLGILAIFGRGGAFNAALGLFGLEPVGVFGLRGVLLAHVFFNLPFATRMLLAGWGRVPAESFRLADSLDLRGWRHFRAIEWPMLRQVAPGALLVVFLLCLTSFAVVLMLGGGPRATTIELAIYQAFRFDFDLGRAALLGLVQLGLGLGAAVLALAAGEPPVATGLGGTVRRHDGRGWRRPADGALLLLATLFVAAPMLAVLVRGLPWLAMLGADEWRALGRSFLVAGGAVALVAALGLPLALTIGGARGRLARAGDVLGSLSIAASPLVLGTGLFIILFPVADPVALALPLTALVNALMALPFVLRALVPAVSDAHRRFDRLAESLDLPPVTYLRRVVLPHIRAPLGFSLGLAAAFSMGDLGVVTLFAAPDEATLPLAMYGLMGAYRNGEAAAAAIVLVVAAFGLFLAFDGWGRRGRT